MRRSAEVKDTLLHFYEVFSAPDLEGFAQIITQEADESVLVIGWVADRPRAVLPEGAISTRLTGVVRQEEGEWKLVHIHLSVGVPDEEVVELQKRWSS